MNRNALVLILVLGLFVLAAVGAHFLFGEPAPAVTLSGDGDPAVDGEAGTPDADAPGDGTNPETVAGHDGTGDRPDAEAFRPISREEEARLLAEPGSGAVPWSAPDPRRIEAEPVPEFEPDRLDDLSREAVEKTIMELETVEVPAIDFRLRPLRDVVVELARHVEVSITFATEELGDEPIVLVVPERASPLMLLREAAHQRGLGLRFEAGAVTIVDPANVVTGRE